MKEITQAAKGASCFNMQKMSIFLLETPTAREEKTLYFSQTDGETMPNIENAITWK